jgi:serine/threonine protein kinase
LTSASVLGGVLATLRDLPLAGVGDALVRGGALAALGAIAVLLHLRSGWPLRQVRLVEAAVFLVLTLYLLWNSTVFGFSLLTVAYGVFTVNPLRRAAVAIGSISAASVVSAVVVPASGATGGVAFDLAARDRLFEIGLAVGSSGLVAIVASFVIFTLYNYAFDQRKRTFYDLEERIGSGGMGEVWRGRHQTLARPTAIKLIREDKIAGVDAEASRRVLRRFEREAKATAALRSPHTIEVYDFGVTGDGHFYYAMEFLVGLDLQALVEQFGPLPAERAVHLLLQACDSLEDAHDHGMTHRDIKPANLFLSRLGPSRDHLKLLDFGLVQEVNPVAPSSKLTAEGTTAGTPAYMAPEMVVGRDVDQRADIYSLGCVAYWLCTGSMVFQTESGVEQIVEHVKTVPTPPSARTTLVIPPALEVIVMRCLEKVPGDRYESARALSTALHEVPVPAAWDAGRADRWWDEWTPPPSAADLAPAMVRTTIGGPVPATPAGTA